MQEHPTAPVKTDLRIQRTYKLLRDALFDLLTQKPFDEITVQEICEKAMVRRATFYHHFEDKYHFLNWCIRDLQQQFFNENIPFDSKNDPEEYYRYAIRHVVRFLKEYHAQVSAVLRSTVNQPVLDVISRQFVEECIERINVNPEMHFDVPVPLIAEFFVGGLVAAAKWWFSQDADFTEEQLCDYVVRLIPLPFGGTGTHPA